MLKLLPTKGWCELVPAHAMKAYRGGRSRVPLILNLGTRRRPVATFTLRSLTPGKEPRYPLNRRMGGPHSQTEWFYRKENLFSRPGFEPVPSSPWPRSQLLYTCKKTVKISSSCRDHASSVTSHYSDWAIPACTYIRATNRKNIGFSSLRSVISHRNAGLTYTFLLLTDTAWQEIFFFPKTSRPPLRPTQPPIL
jgi:hypothetical protein